MHRFPLSFRRRAGVLAVGLVVAFVPRTDSAGGGVAHDPGRHFDARVGLEQSAPPVDRDSQSLALDELRAAVPELAVTFDPVTGATRTLVNRVGYLSEPDLRAPRAIADAYIHDSLERLGLSEQDVAGRELTDIVYSKATGATHIYYRQRTNGLAVYNTQLHVNVNREGRVLSVNNSFVPALAAALGDSHPSIEAADAVAQAAAHLGAASPIVQVQSMDAGPRRETRLDADGFSTGPVAAQLMLLPVRRGEVRLVWNFQIRTVDRAHAYDFTVDAVSGQVWTRFDWTAGDRYRVFARPAESPNHAAVLPPDDGRTTVENPHDPVASPFGWHDTDGRPGPEFGTLRGNAAQAYDDEAGTNQPPADEPYCGESIDCVFPVYPEHEVTTYRPAALVNLFYWVNLLHDIQYAYGFDEAAGNFQVTNRVGGGLGGDAVLAEAHPSFNIFPMPTSDFTTPPDGQPPRLQMFSWFTRERAFDNGLIVHEYGHGIANRQVGGPSNVNCLTNAQQPGEGLSDWWALVYTATAQDTGARPRGIGTYALGHPPTGAGLRELRYSTDPRVNPWTYESIANRDPYVIGAVWAQALWRVYWTLVDHHGFSADLRNADGTAGNQRAMLYVNEGLKNAPCNPTFTDLRDAIVQAAVDNHAGVDVCRIWDTFASFGLGTDALSGGPDTTLVSNGFSRPISCVNPPPDPTTLIAPLGAVGTLTPTFRWRAVPASAWYQLVVVHAEGTAFERWYAPADVGCATASVCSAPAGSALPPGAVTWRVRTGSSVGYGGWSDTGHFSMVPPAAPTLLEPAGTIAAVRPAFSWIAEPTATWYELWANDSSGNRIRQWYPGAGAGCAVAPAVCRVESAVALERGPGQFWVRGWNDVGYGPWTAPTHFSIGTPDAPATVAPRGPIASASPTYIWSAGAGATWYRLWVDDATGNRLQQWYTADQAGCPSGAGLCQLKPPVVLSAGPARFWVQGWNPLGATAWSPPSDFVVTPAPGVAVVESWPVADGLPGTWVRLWALVTNGTTADLPDGYRLWFEVAGAGRDAVWAGSQSVAGLAAGESRWYFFDWLAAPDAAGYQYRAQIWEGGNERSTPGPTRDFSLGFSSRFYKTTDRWQGTSGSWYLPAQGLARALAGVSLSTSATEVNAAYGTSINRFHTLDFSVTMRRSGCSTCANRMIVRGTIEPQDGSSEWRSWYAFQYTNAGFVSVVKRVDGVTTILQDWTASAAVRQSDTNVLRAIAHGPRLFFYVNGILVWTGTDDDLRDGQVGAGMFATMLLDNTLTISQPTLRDPGLHDGAPVAWTAPIRR